MVKKPQLITILAGVLLVAAIYTFGRTAPHKKPLAQQDTQQHSDNDGHNHSSSPLTIDSILPLAKKNLDNEQLLRLATLENSITRGDVRTAQLRIYHQLAHFWSDSAQIFEPYAWYEAEAARLENSEKTLTFAAHLFLENLQENHDPRMVQWKALQAKDLFERSLKLNPDNDSSIVGLGACYLFGNITDNPMAEIKKVLEVVERDSTNVFAQLTLAKGAIYSGQYDKAVSRLQTVHRINPANLESILMLADIFERNGDKASAAAYYRESLKHIKRADVRSEIEKRIETLK